MFTRIAATIAVSLHFKAEAMRREAEDVLDRLVEEFAPYPDANIEHLASYQYAELRLAIADFLDTVAGWEVAPR